MNLLVCKQKKKKNILNKVLGHEIKDRTQGSGSWGKMPALHSPCLFFTRCSVCMRTNSQGPAR